MAGPGNEPQDLAERLSWRLFLLVVAGATGFIGAAFILAP